MTERIPLALCPGLLCDGRVWTQQIEALSDIADCHVGNFTTQNSMADMARSVLDMMPPRFAVAGHSMGGYVAMEVARQAPERVTHLALLGTRAVLDKPEERQLRLDLLALAKEKGELGAVAMRYIPHFLHPDRLGEKALTDVIVSMAQSTGVESFIGQETALLNRSDLSSFLRGVTQPTLVLCGRQDAMSPLHWSEEMAETIPGAKLVVIEDSGHMVTMERPEAVSAAMREWLQS